MERGSLEYQLALTLIPGIGDVMARNLVSYCGGPDQVFKAKKKDLVRIPGIDEVRATSIIHFDFWNDVEKEMTFIEKSRIQSFFYLDNNYPSRLKGLTDAPILLFGKGNLELNTARMIALVGTRKPTEYGKKFVELLTDGLKEYGVTVVSGLAYGIDIHAHRAALKNNLATIGVLAHGLNRLYPGSHRATAVKMLELGGLLTELKSIDAFEPQNFPKRNRIVAGLCDATIVVESAVGGGALITAEIANNYNRDVFAVPGNVGEKYSEGCNYFIKTNRASLLEAAADVAYIMGWKDQKSGKPKQKELFIEMDENETRIFNLLKENGGQHVDSISHQTHLTPSQLAATLLNLEFKGAVKSLPGKMYQIA